MAPFETSASPASLTSEDGANFDDGAYGNRACGSAGDDTVPLSADAARAAGCADASLIEDTFSLGCLANKDVAIFDSGRDGVRAFGPTSNATAALNADAPRAADSADMALFGVSASPV